MEHVAFRDSAAAQVQSNFIQPQVGGNNSTKNWDEIAKVGLMYPFISLKQLFCEMSTFLQWTL